MSDIDLGRVCNNLVNKALTAMGEAGLVELTLAIRSEHVLLRTHDTAGGMDEAFVPRAFDRFSRADDACAGGGVGLGLSIVTGILAVSGSEIMLDNRPNALSPGLDLGNDDRAHTACRAKPSISRVPSTP